MKFRKIGDLLRAEYDRREALPSTPERESEMERLAEAIKVLDV